MNKVININEKIFLLMIGVLFLFFPLIQSNYTSVSYFLLPIVVIITGLFFAITSEDGFNYIIILPVFYFFFNRVSPDIGNLSIGSLLSYPLYWVIGFILVLYNRRVPNVIILFIFISLLFLIIISSNTYNGTFNSIFIVLNKFLYQFQLIPLIIIGYYLATKKNTPNNVFENFLYVLIFVLALVFILDYFLDWNYTFSKARKGYWAYRLTGFEENPNFIANLLMPFALVGTLFKLKGMRNIVVLLCIILALFLTDSRSSIYSFLFLILLLFFFNKNYRNYFLKIIRRYTIHLVILILLITIVFFVTDIKFRMYDTFIDLISHNNLAQKSERLQVWPQFWEYVKQKPFFGFGLLEAFPVIGGAGTIITYIDSTYFHALLKFGLIGLILSQLPNFLILASLLKIKKKGIAEMFIIIALLNYFAFGIFTFADNLPPLQLAYLFYGMILKNKKYGNDESCSGI